MTKARGVAAVTVLLLLATGCLRGTSPTATNTDEIVWAISAADREAHQATADLWNEEFPDTPLRIDFLPDDADQQRIQIGLEQNAQTTNFDVIAMDVIWTGEFALYGWVEDLSDLRGDVEGVSLDGPLASCGYEGALWCLPYNSNTGLLYYRTDLVDDPPTTWEEALEVGIEVAQEEGIAPWVGQGAQYEGLVVNYLEYFFGAGGQVFGDDESDVAFGDDPAAVTAAEFMIEAQQSGFFAPGFNTMQEDQARVRFQDGGAVFMRNWPFAYALMEEEEGSAVVGNFDVAPLPVFDEGESSATIGGFNNAVSAFTAKPDAAREFVVWAATDPDVQALLAENSLPPTLASTYDDLGDDPVLPIIGELLEDATPRPAVPDYNTFSIAVQRQIFPSYNGDRPAEDAVEAIVGTLDEIVARRSS